MKGIKQVKNYRLLKEIGKGTTGTVYEAVDDSNGKKYAIKSIPSAKLENKRILENFKRELKLLYGLNHNNIIKIAGIEKTVNNTYLALEFCNGGNLYEYLAYYKHKFSGPLPEDQVQFIVKQIINGLEYMHKNKIVHRDIKLENILLNFNSINNIHLPNQENVKLDYSKLSLFDCSIKIADLGYARELDGASLASTICGTPITMAPDVFTMKADNKYNSKADLWSLGAITYELLTGNLPFYGKNIDNLIENVVKGKYSFPNSLKISLEAIVFINGLLQFYANKRYDWNQIVTHPFIINDTSTFHRVHIEKIDLDVNNCEKLHNNTKDCGNFLWVLFKSSIKNLSLDKVDLEKFLIDEVDGFKKILETSNLKLDDKNNVKPTSKKENTQNDYLKCADDVNISSSSYKVVGNEKADIKIKVVENTYKDLQEIIPIDNKQVSHVDEHYLIKEEEIILHNEKIDNCNKKTLEIKFYEKFDTNITITEESKHQNQIDIEAKTVLNKLKDGLSKEITSNIPNEIMNKNEDLISNKHLKDEEDIWEIISSNSITSSDQIEILKLETNYILLPEYFNIKEDL